MTDDGVSYKEIPRLEDWLSIPEAALELGVSKQMVHKMINTLDVFDYERDVRKVGDKPMYLVRESAVKALKKSRDGVNVEE